MDLILCGACHRHIRLSEPQCPFCHPERRARGPAHTAAAIALAVGMGLSVGACMAYGPPPRPGVDSGPPPASDSGTVQDAGPSLPDGNVMALYGPAPVEEDASAS